MNLPEIKGEGKVAVRLSCTRVKPLWWDYLARQDCFPGNTNTNAHTHGHIQIYTCRRMCTYTDKTSCGGAADRLRLLPYLVFWAHSTRRLLFVHWSRPHPLQSFLVPNSPLDWRIPPWLSKELLKTSKTAIIKSQEKPEQHKKL